MSGFSSDLFRLGVSAGENLEILCDGAAASLAELSCDGVTDPTVDTATSGVDPHQVLEAEVLSVRNEQD